jgi:hypothetical protein
MRVTHKATRAANNASKKIGKTSGTSSANQAEGDDFTSEWPEPVSGYYGNFGGFGGFCVIVTEERCLLTRRTFECPIWRKSRSATGLLLRRMFQ